MLHRLRSVLIRPGRELLSGQVEVDETYIGGEQAGLAGGRAKGKKALIAVAVEVVSPTGFGRCRMRISPDGSASTLHPFITDPTGVRVLDVAVKGIRVPGVEHLVPAPHDENQLPGQDEQLLPCSRRVCLAVVGVSGVHGPLPQLQDVGGRRGRGEDSSAAVGAVPQLRSGPGAGDAQLWWGCVLHQRRQSDAEGVADAEQGRDARIFCACSMLTIIRRLTPDLRASSSRVQRRPVRAPRRRRAMVEAISTGSVMETTTRVVHTANVHECHRSWSPWRQTTVCRNSESWAELARGTTRRAARPQRGHNLFVFVVVLF